VSDHSRVGLECLRLSKYAPKEIRDQIEAILKSNSQYLDRTALLDYLTKRDWTTEEFSANLFIDQSKVIKDVQEGNVLKNFMSKYNDIKLDVVSLAEVEELV